jgi:hypothetical protein
MLLTCTMESDPTMLGSKNLFLLLRIAISCGILYIIFNKLEYDQMKHSIPNLIIPFLVLSFLFVLLDRVLMSQRWNILLKAKNTIIPFVEIVRIYFMTSFLGMFVPSSVAPDAMRAYLATKYNCTNACAISSVFLDRIIGFLTLSTVALISCLVLFLNGNSRIISTSMLVLVLMPFLAIVLWLLLHKFAGRILQKFSGTRYFDTVYRILVEFYSSLVSYKNDVLDLIKVTTICFVNHGLFIITVYLITLSLNVQISIVHLCIFIPLVTFVTMVPISMGGLGVQEGAYVYLFSRSGLSVQDAFAVAFLIRVVTTLACIPGGVLYLNSGFQRKKILE